MVDRKLLGGALSVAADYRVQFVASVAQAQASAASVAAGDDAVQSDLFQTWIWFDNLVRHGLAPDVRFKFAVVSRIADGQAFCLPLAVFPLDAVAIIGEATSSLTTYYASLYGPIGDDSLCTQAACQALIRALRAEGLPHGALHFKPLDVDSTFYRHMLNALREVGYLTDTHFCFGNWHLPCQGVPYDAYAATLPSRLRNTIRRARKKLDGAGQWRIRVHLRPGPELEEAIADFEVIYGQSWKVPEPFPHFVPELCRAAAKHGWLRLGVLQLDNRPVAAQIWLVRDGQALIYKLAYDEALRSLSPGSILSAELFRRALDDDHVIDVDYLTGDDAYKRDWMTHRRERRGIVAFHPRTLAGMAGALRHFGGIWLSRLQRKIRSLTAAPVARPSDARPTIEGPAAMVLGLDSHGLAVARALADAGVPVYAMRRESPLPGAFTNRVRRTFPVATLNDDALIPALLAARKELPQLDRIALIAINDRQVSVIARHLDLLQPHYRIAWADRAATILALLRKDSLEAQCQQQGLSYPRSITFSSAAEAAGAADFRYPVIIKPVQPLSSFKTLMARNFAELEQLLQTYAQDLPILGQEYIAGDDSAIYFGALMLDKGRVLFGMAGRKIASHPPAMGQTTVAETVDEPEVLRLTEQFFKGMNLSGPVSLELKKDADGNFWVIEPTVGRTDFWSELCISAGFNQPHMEFQLACGLPVSLPDRLQPCVWFDSERDPLAYPKLCLEERRAWPRGKRPVFPFMGHADPMPWLRAMTQFVIRRIRQYIPWPRR